MRMAAAVQRYYDFDQQAEQLSGFERIYQQLDCGPYAGLFLACHGGEMKIFAERNNRRMSRQGAGPSGTISAVLLLESSGHAISNGLTFTPGDVALVGSGGAYEATCPADTQTFVFTLSLESSVPIQLRHLANRQAGRVRRVNNPELARKLRALAANIVRSWDEASQSVSMPQSVLQGLLLNLLVSPNPVDGSSHTSMQLYWAARDVMLNALGEPLKIPEIARRVGTSRRTLELAFDRCISVSPAKYHKLLRLNNARRLLKSGQHSVNSAATRSGLHHLGRFSDDYHRLFGEMPSKTALRARKLTTRPD